MGGQELSVRCAVVEYAISVVLPCAIAGGNRQSTVPLCTCMLSTCVMTAQNVINDNVLVHITNCDE